MCKVKIKKNDKVMKQPKATFPQYLTTELGAKLQAVASDNDVSMNWIVEYGIRKALGMPTTHTEIKEIVVA